jgi:lysophospholipase L1-like esterase
MSRSMSAVSPPHVGVAARRRSPARFAVFALLPAVLLFGSVELALRFFMPGYMTVARSIAGGTSIHLAILRSPTEHTAYQLPVNPHEPDDLLGWRNKRNFQHALYRTNSNGILAPRDIPYTRTGPAYRLLVLGDSATVGMGLERWQDTWPQVLESRGAGRIEVVNGATVCYSSEQAARFLLHEGSRYDVDGVAVYVGSADGIPSSMTDRELLDGLQRTPTGWAPAFNSWAVGHSDLYVALRTLGIWGLAAAQGRDFTQEQARIARVPVDQYRENLLAIVNWARSRGADVWLITPPTPLEYPPGVHDYNLRYRYQPGWHRDACLDGRKRPDGLIPAVVDTEETRRRYPALDFIGLYAEPALGCLSARRAEQRGRFEALRAAGDTHAVVANNLGYLYYLDGDLDRAGTLFGEAIAHDPEQPAYLYNRGIVERRQGRLAEARVDLQHAIDLDGPGSKIHSTYLATIREIAATEPGVGLVDANQVFRDGDNEHLFSDHVHPTARGQALVADLMLAATQQRVAVVVGRRQITITATGGTADGATGLVHP